jgi:hypothetical protein
MKVQALWCGGSNYAAPTQDDIEEFHSLKAAKDTFWRRAENCDRSTPCVQQDQTEMHIYFGEYSENGPDRIIRYGKRGGIVVERG